MRVLGPVDRIGRAHTIEWAGEALRGCPDELVIACVSVLAVRSKMTSGEALVGLILAGIEGEMAELGDLDPSQRDMLVGLAGLAARVSRRPSLTKEAKKVAYLEALKDTCNAAAAAEEVGISQSTPYAWARVDPEFLAQFNEARQYAGMKELP